MSQSGWQGTNWWIESRTKFQMSQPRWQSLYEGILLVSKPVRVHLTPMCKMFANDETRIQPINHILHPFDGFAQSAKLFVASQQTVPMSVVESGQVVENGENI